MYLCVFRYSGLALDFPNSRRSVAVTRSDHGHVQKQGSGQVNSRSRDDKLPLLLILPLVCGLHLCDILPLCHASGCSVLAHRRVTGAGEMQAESPAQPGRALACAAPCGYDRRRRLRMVLWSVQFCASAAVLQSDGLLLLHCFTKAVYA